MRESSSLIGLIQGFLTQNNLKYQDLNNIVVVHGPGSFTGIRTVALIVNSIAFAIPNLSLTPISFFDLLDRYPMIKSSSKRDLFVKKMKWDKIEVVNNTDFIDYIDENKIQKIYGDVATDFLGQREISFEVDYQSIIENIELVTKREITPLYMKKPNIT